MYTAGLVLFSIFNSLYFILYSVIWIMEKCKHVVLTMQQELEIISTLYVCMYMGCPESFRTFKIARHCVDLVLLSSNEFDELHHKNHIALSCLFIVLYFFM